MAKLIVVDPLDLFLKGPDGSEVWNSQSCFEACCRDLPGVSCEFLTAKDPELCRRALRADGVILGGSDASAWEDTVFNDHLLDLIAICKNNEIPLLAICYGAQLLGRALGGHVAPHPGGIELGAPPIRMSEKGKKHFLFEGIENGCIWSVETHWDAILTLPPRCELLASTEHTPVQAFSYQDLLTGVQFHPEMDGDDLRHLWSAFIREGIVDAPSVSMQRQLETCQCSRALPVFRNFAKRVVAGRSAGVAAKG